MPLRMILRNLSLKGAARQINCHKLRYISRHKLRMPLRKHHSEQQATIGCNQTRQQLRICLQSNHGVLQCDNSRLRIRRYARYDVFQFVNRLLLRIRIRCQPRLGVPHAINQLRIRFRISLQLRHDNNSYYRLRKRFGVRQPLRLRK